MKKFHLIILGLILILGFTLRIYKINSVPPGLSNDEIAIAYEAYSIANTARDSIGRFLPVSFKSNKDHRAPLYIYITAPFVKALGNNEMAVRLPSAIFGTLTIFGLYLLVKKLGLGEVGADISAFLLAVTPWHVYTSRIGFEPNFALFIVVFGAYFFLKGLDDRRNLLLSAAFFALSIYAYYTEWVFTPLILVSLTIIYFSKFKNKKDIVLCWLTFIILISPILADNIFFAGGTRASNEMLLNDFVLGNRLAGVGNVFFKGYIVFTFWLDKYLRYIGFDYIFGHGLPISAPYGSPDFGLLNILQFPFYLLGIYYIIRIKNNGTKMILFSWSILGPLIPSLTEGDLNLGRNLVSVIPLTIISACGLLWLLQSRILKPFFVFTLIIILANFVFFYRYYLTYFPIYYSENWSYGFKQIATYVKENESKYKKVVIDYRYGTKTDLYGAPSLFILYFNKIDPASYVKESKSDEKGLFFGKYEFRMIDWPKEKITPRSLYVVGVRSNPTSDQKVKEVYSLNLLNGLKAFQFFESY